MFSGVRIEVDFQLKIQLTFCCTTINVKPRFVVVSLFIAPSQRLAAKNKISCNTHTLL
jgi:hypothetical protein